MKQKCWNSFYKKQHHKAENTERESIEDRIAILEYKVETLERTLAQLILAIQRKAKRNR